MTADFVLTGGLVADGTGAAAVAADLAVAGDRIAAIGAPGTLAAGRRIDCSGRMVAPGFIDAHTHDDAILFDLPDMPMKTSQGVTTVVTGNCGVSTAPVALPGDPPPPLDLLGGRGTYRFARFAEWRRALAAEPAAVNAIGLVGHSALRVCAMDRVDRPATAAEIAAMGEALDGAMADGALGLSTGLFYAPARAAPTAEIVALARIAAAHGGLYATHLRDEGAHLEASVEEALRIGREADLPVVLSHHKAAGKPNHGKTARTLPLIDAARRRQRVALDVYPYVASSTVLSPERVAAATRVLVTWSKPHPELGGRDLADIAREWDVTVEAAAGRLLPAGAIYFAMAEEDVRRVLSWPEAMIGSDGLPHDTHPHPRLWGTFPRVLGHYARDVGLFAVEEAIRRMTSLPAKRLGLRDRGTLRAGAFADIVVFDPKRVIDRATFAEPKLAGEGIERTFVNGRAVWENGAIAGARPGRALARDAAAMDYSA
ncbi:MAG: D-aminoacylase [Magnetospirillum sp.]|nr:D-aminoacylase [Magnetospirillum sp.]